MGPERRVAKRRNAEDITLCCEKIILVKSKEIFYVSCEIFTSVHLSISD